MTTTPPTKPLWFFRKKTILIFSFATLIFLILGGYHANELYQKAKQYHVINWGKIYEPIYMIGGIPIMIYFCIVGFWLIFYLKKMRKDKYGF